MRVHFPRLQGKEPLGHGEDEEIIKQYGGVPVQ